MQRVRLLGLAVMAVFMLGAVAASTASAVALPEFETQTNWKKGTSGAGKLNGAEEIKCKKDTSEGTASSKTLGVYTLSFKECKLLGEECKTLGGTAETIQVNGEYHLVRLKTESAAVWFLVPLTHIECKILKILLLVLGSVLGQITPILTSTKKFAIKVAVVGGNQEFTEYENNAGAKVAVSLLSSVNNGTEEKVTEESAENGIETEAETKIIKTT